MASVLKRFHNFKNSHQFPAGAGGVGGGGGGGGGGKRSPSPSIPEPGKGGRGAEEVRRDPTDDCSDGPNELLHRRKVSISKSGRYKENHKKRSALLDETQKQLEAKAAVTPPASSSTSSKDELRTTFSVKDKEEKNKENEKNRENIIVRRDSIISDIDGHAVADEIESLAKTLTIENALETAL